MMLDSTSAIHDVDIGSAIRDIAEESSQMAAENAESSQELSQQAHRLDQAVARYKV